MFSHNYNFWWVQAILTVFKKQLKSSSRNILGCDAVQCCGRIPTFQRSMHWNFGILPKHCTASQSRKPRIESLPWRWRQHGPLKRWYVTTTLHGVTTEKTSTWIFTVVQISNPELKSFVINMFLCYSLRAPWRQPIRRGPFLSSYECLTSTTMPLSSKTLHTRRQFLK